VNFQNIDGIQSAGGIQFHKVTFPISSVPVGRLSDDYIRQDSVNRRNSCPDVSVIKRYTNQIMAEEIVYKSSSVDQNIQLIITHLAIFQVDNKEHLTTAIMQFPTAALALLSFTFTASAADEQLCFPAPGQTNNVPQSITDLDGQIKIDWATKLCAQIDYSTVDAQSFTTDIADGVKATENGKTYGLNLVYISCWLLCGSLS
jgi:hypothetical protein